MQPESAAEPKVVNVREQPIELCQLLKFGGLTATGGEAKSAIAGGRVLVNGEVELRKRRKLVAGDRVAFGGETIEVQVAR